MSRGKDFRDRRRRGFDDDNFGAPQGGFGYPPMPRQFGGPPRSAQPPLASGPPTEATVKWFSPEKGFGFVEVEGGGDAFLHAAVLGTAGHKTVAPGSKL